MAKTKRNSAYSVVSYFCGCGGLDLGFRGNFRYHDENYEQLPFAIQAAYDREPRCVETYNNYFGAEHASVVDLTTIDVDSVPKANVLIGGFPCQEFSSCGPLGGLETERGRLYQTLITYMKKHNPAIVIGENVIKYFSNRKCDATNACPYSGKSHSKLLGKRKRGTKGCLI